MRLDRTKTATVATPDGESTGCVRLAGYGAGGRARTVTRTTLPDQASGDLDHPDPPLLIVSTRSPSGEVVSVVGLPCPVGHHTAAISRYASVHIRIGFGTRDLVQDGWVPPVLNRAYIIPVLLMSSAAFA